MLCAYGNCQQKRITHFGLQLKTLLMFLCFSLPEGFYSFEWRGNGRGMSSSGKCRLRNLKAVGRSYLFVLREIINPVTGINWPLLLSLLFLLRHRCLGVVKSGHTSVVRSCNKLGVTEWLIRCLGRHSQLAQG